MAPAPGAQARRSRGRPRLAARRRRGSPYAEYAEPRLRCLCPFPAHGTSRFPRSAPLGSGLHHDDLPVLLYGGPPYEVRTSGYADLPGEAEAPAEAVAPVVGHPPRSE
ncbi:DUF6193 family natural product biosynthesis protein [Streptomyces sp. DH37]|uniref:DUF6193 family natural product biosynthesis protein n=1 Tax=Streptomyces sp. DH37 TaxID=3040122 RepID=UPI0034DE74E8